LNNSDKLPAAFPVAATFQANPYKTGNFVQFCARFERYCALLGHSLFFQLKEVVMAKPSIVFAHGLWADGSCFGKLIPTLQAEGHQVMASQHGLDSLATDVAAVKACLARVSSPAVLVGHSSNDHATVFPNSAGG
jgi:hypothetical protein